MSEYIEYKDTLTFHPGYYIKEVIDDMGITQEDFAKRLGTTPKNLSLIIRGEQRLTPEIAMKLSKLLNSSIAYWQNLQSAYDAAEMRILEDKELEQETEVLKLLGYGYFKDHFNLPDLPRNLIAQVVEVRRFLGVSSLCVLKNRDMSVSFRSALPTLSETHVIRANAMIQIAVNATIRSDAPKFDKKELKKAITYALAQTTNHQSFFPLVKEAFYKAGVVLVALPNIAGSMVNGATKKVGSKVMLLVNDRRHYADTFWFTLFHEIGHIENGEFGISFENENGIDEERADAFARDLLIDPQEYALFVRQNRPHFTPLLITNFAKKISRDPGIVVGRLQNDGYVRHNDPAMQKLRHRYEIC